MVSPRAAVRMLSISKDGGIATPAVSLTSQILNGEPEDQQRGIPWAIWRIRHRLTRPRIAAPLTIYRQTSRSVCSAIAFISRYMHTAHAVLAATADVPP